MLCPVAVIVMIAVDGGGAETPPLTVQLVAIPNAARATIMERYLDAFFLRLMKTQKARPKAVIGTNGLLSCGVIADRVGVEIDNIAVAGAPEGVTDIGLKEQVSPLGSPEQAKLTGKLKPNCGVTVSEYVATLPATSVSAGGEACKVNVAFRLIVYAEEAIALFA
jgi:hypothetical protein